MDIDKVLETDLIVTGYHGTSAERAAVILEKQTFEASDKPWDWLGSGIYFWENGPGRAWQWAEEQFPGEAAVVAAEIRLGHCLDLADTRYGSVLRVAYHSLKSIYTARDESLPENRDKARRLDRLVLNYATSYIVEDVETVRAPFIEGDELYPGASFFAQTHIQICVRQHANILKPIRLAAGG